MYRTKPLWKYSDEELESLHELTVDGETRCESFAILRLRRNIEALRQSKVFNYTSWSERLVNDPPLDRPENQKQDILCCFPSYGKLPLMFVSRKIDVEGEENPGFPLTLYVEITETTKRKEILDNWKEIQYWRNYLRRAYYGHIPYPRKRILFYLHTQNIEGKSYEALAKEINSYLETDLRRAIFNQRWVQTFEGELREFLQQSTDSTSDQEIQFSSIIKEFHDLYQESGPIPSEPVSWSPELYQRIPIPSLEVPPERNPYEEPFTFAHECLSELGFDTNHRQECFEKGMQQIREGQPMSEIVTHEKIRGALHWWRMIFEDLSKESPGDEEQ